MMRLSTERRCRPDPVVLRQPGTPGRQYGYRGLQEAQEDRTCSCPHTRGGGRTGEQSSAHTLPQALKDGDMCWTTTFTSCVLRYHFQVYKVSLNKESLNLNVYLDLTVFHS